MIESRLGRKGVGQSLFSTCEKGFWLIESKRDAKKDWL